MEDEQPAPEQPEQEANGEQEAEQPAVDQDEPAKTEPKGATTRQRSGKSTPARTASVPKLAPKPISKAKKTKKKGKGAAAKKAVMSLYGYWRSGCTWRVRLVLALKGMTLGKEVDYIPVHLVKDGGEQKQETYSKINPAQVS